MFYHWLAPLGKTYIIFNLFNYISFRAAGATVTALLLAFVVGPPVIRRLRARKVGQVVRAEGPASHQSKRGTPTMGGLLLGLFLAFNPVVPTDTIPATATTLPFFKYLVVNFAPWLFVVFVTVVITGASNAVNLTDGLDGLATGLAGIAAAAFAVFAYLFGRVDVTTYLNVFYLPGAGELAVFCAALMGATVGFLWFNAHPAEVFMGDTGSLAIGGGLGTGG